MTIKALEELRDCLGDNALHGCIDMDWDEIRPIIYAIEAEVDERFMEFPLGGDGKPIKPGDEITDGIRKAVCLGVNTTDVFFKDGNVKTNRAYGWRCATPRTVEDVIRDAVHGGLTVEGAANEIRELMAE